MMYIESVEITDFKGISNLKIEFDLSHKRPPWTVILGNNATCKTAALRAIGLALCDEASATALMKESVEGYIRRGAKKAVIVVRLRRGLRGTKSYEVCTSITRTKTRTGSYEILRQDYGDASTFPHDEIFACAYGAGRGTAGTGDISGYANIDSLYNLFNYSDGLQNPELTLLRTSARTRNYLIQVLKRITRTKHVKETKSGLAVSGDWGTGMPLRDLSDGYKSTFLWVADFLGWAIEFFGEEKIRHSREIAGIVLIDELDQHLHPEWQTKIVGQLRKAFPFVQFVATTHSPLVASSLGQTEETAADGIFHLEKTAKRKVTSRRVNPYTGISVDQILASHGFDFVSVDSVSTIDATLIEASKLASRKSSLSSSEKAKYRQLRKQIATTQVLLADTIAERELQESFLKFLSEESKRLEKELFE